MKIKTLDNEVITVKQYGNTNTHLKLTAKAFQIYSDSDPLDIYEQHHEPPTEVYVGGGMSTFAEYTYYIRGIAEADNLTEAEVNEFIEELGE